MWYFRKKIKDKKWYHYIRYKRELSKNQNYSNHSKEILNHLYFCAFTYGKVKNKKEDFTDLKNIQQCNSRLCANGYVQNCIENFNGS